jgi:hypothetical protein
MELTGEGEKLRAREHEEQGLKQLSDAPDEVARRIREEFRFLGQHHAHAHAEEMRQLVAAELGGADLRKLLGCEPCCVADAIKKRYRVESVADAFYPGIRSATSAFLDNRPSYGGGTFFSVNLQSMHEEAQKASSAFHHALQDANQELFREEALKRIRDAREAYQCILEKFCEEGDEYHTSKVSTYTWPLVKMPCPVGIPEHLRFEGTWIIAPPGTGKTTLLSCFLRNDLDLVKQGKASIVLMDSKGDLVDHAKRLALFDGPLRDKLVLIEPSGDLAINPLDLGGNIQHTVGLIEYLFSFGSAATPKQSALFRSILIALGEVPGANFATLRRFLREGWEPFREYVERLHPDDRDFFMRPGPSGVSEFDSKDYTTTKQELLWRIQDLTTRVPMLREMFRATRTKLDLGREIDAGKVIIVDNSRKVLGDSGSEFFGRLFLALIRGQAEQRAGRREEEKLPCYVYIDECDTVIARDENVNVILAKCRSQKIGLVLAHQKLIDIESDTVKAALKDSGVRIANVDDEAAELAPRMRADVDMLRSLGRGEFAVFMRRVTGSALRAAVPNDPISEWPTMSDASLARIREEMRARYCQDPEAPPAPPEEPTEDTSPAAWG